MSKMIDKEIQEGDFATKESNCKHEVALNAIHSKIKTYRDYWLFTEVFCLLHDNTDYCNCNETKQSNTN